MSISVKDATSTVVLAAESGKVRFTDENNVLVGMKIADGVGSDEAVSKGQSEAILNANLGIATAWVVFDSVSMNILDSYLINSVVIELNYGFIIDHNLINNNYSMVAQCQTRGGGINPYMCERTGARTVGQTIVDHLIYNGTSDATIDNGIISVIFFGGKN